MMNTKQLMKYSVLFTGMILGSPVALGFLAAEGIRLMAGSKKEKE